MALQGRIISHALKYIWYFIGLIQDVEPFPWDINNINNITLKMKGWKVVQR